MIIEIKKIARDIQVKTPDLITRPIGRKMYEKVTALMAPVGEGEVVVIDFAGIRVLDSSFIDEFLVRLITDARSGAPFFLKLRNISPIAENNIDAVFYSYYTYNSDKIAVTSDTLTSKNCYHFGILSEEERDLLDYLRVNKRARIGDLSSFAGKEPEEIRNLMEGLFTLRLARKEEGMECWYLSV